MTRAKTKLTVSDDGHDDVKRKSEEGCEGNIVQFVNPTKRKKSKVVKENLGIHSTTETDSVNKEKKVRFSHEGETLPEVDPGKKGEAVGPPKKKIRKPRWSDERKIEERKRRAEETPVTQVEEPRPKKKRKKKNKIFHPETVASTSGLSTSALQYLQHWRYDRSSWKFSKLKQTWLLKHTFDSRKIPANMFPILVDYIASSKGGARLKTYEAAANIIRKLEEKASAEESEHDEQKEIMQCLEGEEDDKEEKHQRARSIMQQLSDCT
ncbi:uncharacterized protein C7orf50 homolog [Ischnura elegans]|uniref:uncharacterized protein C7orf50 homolog n=1 Tax=Ischnura elegans TaxID=197161 RepID=UPI001ED8A5F6|nr:uncharacterized protein C7orf50 homolog [Ischnura elegans]